MDADAQAVYTSGHLLFVRQDTLFAQRFDPDRAEATGIPVAIAQQVALPYRWGAPLASSLTGLVAFRPTGSATGRQLIWFDRSGREVAKVGDADLVTTGTVALSPDATRLAFSGATDGNTDVWMFEIARGILTRITFDPGLDSHPLWSPDGKRLIFQRFHDGVGDLLVHPASTDGREELLLTNMGGNIATDWPPDGRVLIKSTGILSGLERVGWDIGVLPVDGDRKLRPLAQTAFVEGDAQFSPDQQWIAYQSNESGQFEIYVQRFPTGGRERISPNGGAQVRWRADGKELFYLALDGRLMSVPVRVDAQASKIQAGVPVPLFATRIGPAVLPVARQQYSVSADGQRFLMNVITGEEKTMPITVVINSKDLQN